MIETLKEFIHSIDYKKRLFDVDTHEDMIVKLAEVSKGLGRRFYNRTHKLIKILNEHILSIDHQWKIGYLKTIISCFYLNMSLLRKVQKEYVQQRQLQFPGTSEEVKESSPSQQEDISIQEPYVPSKSKDLIFNTFMLIFKAMMSIAEDIPQIWLHPPNDFDDNNFENLRVDDGDSYLVYSLRFLINHLSIILENDLFMTIIKDKIVLDSNDGWKERFSKTMCIPISKHMKGEDVKEVMELLRQRVNDGHEKVRFGVVQILIELSQDVRSENFHEEYFHEVMVMALNGLDDISERVRSHWLICLGWFCFAQFDKTQILQYSNKMLHRLYQLIESQSVFTKKHALTVLATISPIPLLHDEKTIQKPFQVFNKILESYPVGVNQKFVGWTFEYCSYIIGQQSDSLVYKYILDFFNKFNSYCSKIDPSSAVKSWQNTIKKGEFDETRHKILEKIIGMPYSNIEIQYIRSIQKTVESYPLKFEEHFEDAVENLNKIFDLNAAHHQEQIVSSSLIALMTIYRLVKPQYEQWDWKDGVREFIKESMIPKMNLMAKSQYYSCFDKLWKEFKVFVQSSFQFLSSHDRFQLISFMNKLFNQVQNYDYQRKLDLNFLREQQEEEYEIQIYVDQSMSESSESKFIRDSFYYSNLNEYQLIQRIAMMKKTKKQMSLFLIDLIEKLQNPQFFIKPIYDKTQGYTLDSDDIEMAINMVNRILQKFNILTPEEIMFGSADQLQLQSGVQEVHVRKDIVRNMEIIIDKIPQESMRIDVVKGWVMSLKQACKTPQVEYLQSDLDSCIHYSVAVLGKLIMKYNHKFNLKDAYKDWFQILPVKILDGQSFSQIEVLSTAFSGEQNLIFGNESSENVEKLQKIMKIFGSFNKVNMPNEQQVKFGFLCKKVLKAVTNQALFKENKEKIEQNLSEQELGVIKYFAEFTKNMDKK